jgi:fumarate hydratase subunit beta
MIRLQTPLTKPDIAGLKAGDEVFLSGSIYTARDQAHVRMVEAVKKGKELPFDLRGQVIYYCGPAPSPKGKTIGSCGPTTSKRMDAFTPLLLERGLLGMIGKGVRGKEVIEAIKNARAVYLLAYAGCGALLCCYCISAKVIAYPELGPEAVIRLEVKDFPLIVGIDSRGLNIYQRLCI